VYPQIFFLAFFQASLPPGIPLVRDCSEPEAVLAVVSQNDSIQVRSSLAGGASTCYAVTAAVDGKPVSGYILGNVLPAIAEFERQRKAPPAPVVEANAALPAAAVVEQPHLPVFGDFSARDMKGRPVSLRGLGGKVTLVCFWSPSNKVSLRELLTVSGLFGQFRRAGLRAVGISLSSERSSNDEVLEDFNLTFPTVSNTFGIADRYNVSSASLPRTYVLNDKQEIVAVGLHGKNLERRIQQLMLAP
jgi:peroxiredoxin